MRTWAAVLGVCLVLFSSGQAPAPEAPAPPQDDAKTQAPSKQEPKGKGSTRSAPKAKTPRRGTRGGSAFYKGRPIAPVMGFEGSDWLMRPEREVEERPDQMVDALKIRPGDVVADVGAGTGYISLRLAQRVGPKGKVFATDLQPQMLQALAENARTAGFKNIQPIRCTPSDPKLPKNTLDLVLMVDVYHECSQPEATLLGLRQALKSGGRLVLVEFRAEDPDVPIKPEHKMTLAQVRLEIEPIGFAFKESLEFLPWQHIIIFEKSADDAEKGDTAKKPAEKAKNR
jgi:ubiquinone/menaquinone biosynthesis C-methylase UbiE